MVAQLGLTRSLTANMDPEVALDLGSDLPAGFYNRPASQNAGIDSQAVDHVDHAERDIETVRAEYGKVRAKFEDALKALDSFSACVFKQFDTRSSARESQKANSQQQGEERNRKRPRTSDLERDDDTSSRQKEVSRLYLQSHVHPSICRQLTTVKSESDRCDGNSPETAFSTGNINGTIAPSNNSNSLSTTNDHPETNLPDNGLDDSNTGPIISGSFFNGDGE